MKQKCFALVRKYIIHEFSISVSRNIHLTYLFVDLFLLEFGVESHSVLFCHDEADKNQLKKSQANMINANGDVRIKKHVKTFR